ncbi:MAG: ParB/RepB/Spo0J family partition protein [Oscillospiraceae bacterium]|nr:ParB/RepB/Spo0J family partition protein [Oscillospiraceae bacterium]
MIKRSATLLTSVEDLFTTQEERDDRELERVQNIAVSDLQPFKNHPFKVFEGEEMEKMIESVRQFGVITPAVARPLSGSKYEIVSGHRRLEACRKLGIETMPVVVREMTDDEAIIAMVDANLQRETILPSEKAFAYKMKLEALKHQGRTSDQLGPKLTAEYISDDESVSQVKRYIRLTNLTPELLEMVDEGKIAFSPAVEISFLTENEQRLLLDAMDMNNCTPSHAQSIRLKKLSQEGSLTDEMIENIMSEEKPNQKENIKFKREDFKKFFPPSYTDKQMKADILKGLELLQRQRERNRDAR